MKKIYLWFCLTALVVSLLGCHPVETPAHTEETVRATDYGLSTDNAGEENSVALQALIDRVSVEGGTIYIPAGEYLFAENGSQTIGSHCIKMRSNVSIVGDGEGTVLKPVGHSKYGLDMFYFNDYLDTNEAVYLENCRFEGFVIDAIGTSCETYTSAGKGFMFNLFRDCHWRDVTVKHTDATGFGVDCPIDSTITQCVAIGCGKAATEESTGASGFGIGFGYCAEECLLISDCRAEGNKKFGFFFEHQGYFDKEKYPAVAAGQFTVKHCTATANLYGFGGVGAMNTTYEQCHSQYSGRYGFLFENSTHSKAIDCQSQYEGEASFALLQTVSFDAREMGEIAFLRCTGQRSPIGVKIMGEGAQEPLAESRVEACQFFGASCTVYTRGRLHRLELTDNVSDTHLNELLADVVLLQDSGNSWNE